MAHKYNKINKEAVLSLFSEKEVINTQYIKEKLGCSRYSVIRVVEELKDDNKIKLSNHGYRAI